MITQISQTGLYNDARCGQDEALAQATSKGIPIIYVTRTMSQHSLLNLLKDKSGHQPHPI